MDDVRQFWIAAGAVLDAACLAQSTVRVALSDGHTIEGIPDRAAAVAAPQDQLDETGLARVACVGGASIELQHVTEIVLVRPLLPPVAVPGTDAQEQGPPGP